MSDLIAVVMAGLVPAIHALLAARKMWMRATPARLRASCDALCAGMTAVQDDRDVL
jgi:hypothetical protein